MHASKTPFATLLYAGVAALASGTAQATTESITADIEFAVPVTLTKNSDIDLGVLKASTLGIYDLATNGTLMVFVVGEILGGTVTVGDVTIAGSTTQAIDITYGNLVASNGASVAYIKCSYDGGAEGFCTLSNQAAPGVGKTLLLGGRFVADGTQAAGTTAAPTFDLIVTYD